MLQKEYTIEEVTPTSRKLGSGGESEGVDLKLRATYQRTKRKKVEEEVDFIQGDVLKATIYTLLHHTTDKDDGLVHEEDEADRMKEYLKPMNMAQVSPRMYWSLIYLYSSVTQGLTTLFPDEDWDFLDVTYRRLSKRAKANELQALTNPKKPRRMGNFETCFEGNMKAVKFLREQGLTSVRKVACNEDELEFHDEDLREIARLFHSVELFTGILQEYRAKVEEKTQLSTVFGLHKLKVCITLACPLLLSLN